MANCVLYLIGFIDRVAAAVKNEKARVSNFAFGVMSTNNGSTASDIITYIGVPLAVLGGSYPHPYNQANTVDIDTTLVLPILYNTFATLASLSRIKRMLQKSRLTALTRSDVINRVIEIDLPRYAVRPLDRFSDRSDYWSLSSHPSSIPGGSWSTFNWKTNTIGMKTQRVEYAEEVRQPQVDIAFDDLVSYLMDLGAVADPQGWRLLRSTGLWTPAGCSLMRSPDGKEMALTVAAQDNADGNLSLSVRWHNEWTSRDCSSMPPYWVRLPAPTARDCKNKAQSQPLTKDIATEEVDGPATTNETGGQVELEEVGHDWGDISCQILTSGIVAAIPDGERDESMSSTSSLSIDHLRAQLGASHGVWFAAAATAYGTTSNTVLWNYRIPDEIMLFSRKDSIPCGVLVLLEIVDESLTPDWATKHDDAAAAHERFAINNRERHREIMAEKQMSPTERQAAETGRMRKDLDRRMQESKSTFFTTWSGKTRLADMSST